MRGNRGLGIGLYKYQRRMLSQFEIIPLRNVKCSIQLESRIQQDNEQAKVCTE